MLIHLEPAEYFSDVENVAEGFRVMAVVELKFPSIPIDDAMSLY